MSHIDHLFSLQLKRKRMENFFKGLIAAVLGAVSILFVGLEPQYLMFVGMIALMAVIAFFGVQVVRLDPNEPDGGESKAKGNGCIFVLAFLFSGLWALDSLLSAIMETEHYEFAITYGLALGLSIWFYPKIKRLTAKRYPEIWRLEYECGICEAECYKDGRYYCPVCDFVSTSQKYHGLKQHYDKAHREMAENLPIFSRICAYCVNRSKSKKMNS